MFFYLLLLFTLVPLAELGLLFWISTQTTWWFTLGLVIATGILGASLARWQGWRTAAKIQAELRGGNMPADAMLDALLIFAAGLVLITPGVLTDLLGFSLLVPPVRKLFKRRIVGWAKRHAQVQTSQFTSSFGFSDIHRPAERSTIIDAKVIETDQEDSSE